MGFRKTHKFQVEFDSFVSQSHLFWIDDSFITKYEIC